MIRKETSLFIPVYNLCGRNTLDKCLASPEKKEQYEATKLDQTHA